MKINTTQTILNLLQALQKISPDFPIQYAICLLHISYDEGLSLTDLAKRAEIPLSTTSRIIGALSDHRRCGQAFGLVSVGISSTERRRKMLYLTPRGKKVIQEISQILGQHSDQRLHA